MKDKINNLIAYYLGARNFELPDDKLDVVILDDIDFFNEVKNRTNNLDLSEHMVLTIPPDDDNNKYTLMVKDTLLGNNSSYGIEVLFTHLSDIVLSLDRECALLEQTCKRNRLFFNAIHGYELWKEFFSIYLSQQTLQSYYEEMDEGDNFYNEEHAYTEVNTKKIAIDILKNIFSEYTNYSADDKISLILYAFAKLMIIDTDKKKVFNIAAIVADPDGGKILQKLYTELRDVKSPSILQLNHIGSLSKKLFIYLGEKGGELSNEQTE